MIGKTRLGLSFAAVFSVLVFSPVAMAGSRSSTVTVSVTVVNSCKVDLENGQVNCGQKVPVQQTVVSSEMLNATHPTLVPVDGKVLFINF